MFAFIGWAYTTAMFSQNVSLIMFVTVAFAIPTIICVFYCSLTVRRTHRVAGAAFRLVQDIQNIINNPGFRFHLRKGDYLIEVVDELNRAMECLEARNTGLVAVAEHLDDVYMKIVQHKGKMTDDEIEELRLHLERATHSLTVARHGVSPD